ncbi:MAG: PEGA domain-containing protein [Planctomycetia bacterium]
MGAPAGPARLPRAAALLAGALLAAALCGCGMQRTLTLDSDPPGARVWVDGVARGTTPVTLPFVHPGTWHVRMEKPGFLAVAQDVSVATRTSDLPVVDLPSEVLGGRRDERRVLRLPPLGGTPDPASLQAVRQRALEFRERARREVAEPGTPQARASAPAPAGGAAR